MVYSHPWSFNPQIAVSHYLAMRAASECVAHDECIKREAQKTITEVLIIEQWQFWNEIKAKQQCKQHRECLIAESSTIQNTYTYHTDFEEPARTYW